MSVHERRIINDNKLNIELEDLLKESQNDMQERAHSILLEIETKAVAAKKDVHYHITELIKH